MKNGIRKVWWHEPLRIAILGIVALLLVGVPLWLVLVNSFKTQGEAAQLGLGLPVMWNAASNYREVFVNSRYLLSLRNSLIVTISSEALLFVICVPAAWAFARSRSRYTKLLYPLVIIGVVLPPAVVPTAFLMRLVSLQGTLPALILYTVGMRMSLVVFLLTGFARGLPRELEEAAYVEGATKLRTLWSVVIPMMRSVLWAAFVIVTVLIWNDFYGPLFLLSSRNATLTMGLYSLSSGVAKATAWNTVFAHVVLVSLPLIVVYILAQRQIVQGVSQGAVKG